VPDSMDDPCPGSTRNDGSKDFQGTSTVSLPDGCSTGTKSVDLNAEKVGGPPCPGNACGATAPPVCGDIILEAKYNNCAWEFQVSADSTVQSGTCPENYTEISWPIDTSVVTEDNYCGIVNLYWNGNGCGSVDETRYSTSACVQIHEDCHFNIFNDYLDPTSEDWLLAQNSMDDMAIDCADPTTTSCQAAKAARQGAIEADVEEAYHRAWTWMDPAEEEAQCVAAARSCFREFAEQICFQASTRGWTECPDCP